MMVLSALEVDIASICASIPVFWPVIRDQVLTIFVTREVKVTSTSRCIDLYYIEQADSFNANETSSQGSQVGLKLQLDIEKVSGKVVSPRSQYLSPIESDTNALAFMDSDTGPEVVVQSLSRKA